MPGWIWRTLLVSLALLSAAGCREAHEKTYPVSGVVQFEDGRPVPFGVIEFRASSSAPVARAKIGRDGSFTLGTFTDDDGAVAGRHQVIVVPHATIENTVNDPERSRQHGAHQTTLVAPAYSSYETSGLSAEIKPDADNRQTVKVRRFTPGRPSGR